MALSLGSGSNAIAFLVAAGITYEIIAKDVSSPQTCELNASARAPTLMKWVHIGQVESVLFVTIAAVLERQTRMAIIMGGVLAMVITEFEYLHAKKSGLASGAPPTEQHASAGGDFTW